MCLCQSFVGGKDHVYYISRFLFYERRQYNYPVSHYVKVMGNEELLGSEKRVIIDNE